jgi:hypothetical protein
MQWVSIESTIDRVQFTINLDTLSPLSTQPYMHPQYAMLDVPMNLLAARTLKNQFRFIRPSIHHHPLFWAAPTEEGVT